MFLYQGWYLHKENKTSFLTLCMANFGMTATSLFEIWTPALSYMDWTIFGPFFGLFFWTILKGGHTISTEGGVG